MVQGTMSEQRKSAKLLFPIQCSYVEICRTEAAAMSMSCPCVNVRARSMLFNTFASSLLRTRCYYLFVMHMNTRTCDPDSDKLWMNRQWNEQNSTMIGLSGDALINRRQGQTFSFIFFCSPHSASMWHILVKHMFENKRANE